MSSWDSNVTESPSLRLQVFTPTHPSLIWFYLPKVTHPLHPLYCRTEIFKAIMEFFKQEYFKRHHYFHLFFQKHSLPSDETIFL